MVGLISFMIGTIIVGCIFHFIISKRDTRRKQENGRTRKNNQYIG
jgi:preprotein translocase subunit YajC